MEGHCLSVNGHLLSGSDRTKTEWKQRWCFPPLTDGLLVNYEAADDAVIVASDGEAVPPEDDVEGLCGT